MDTDIPATSNPSENPQEGKKRRFNIPPEWKKPLLYGGIVLGILLVGYFYWQSRTHQKTDDAYVAGHLHYVSPRISGVVQKALVKDNQRVEAGALLVVLDPADYQTQLDEATAQYDKAKSDLDRLTKLVAANAISQLELDHAQNDFNAAKARLDEAKLQVDYTQITAPASGTVGRKNVEAGNRVQPGQTLMVIVEDQTWIIANFKETQLAKMKPGQPVDLEIDALPGKTFTGKIESISPASGNQFALLPADNATGNFTKIVQRVPVKIVFDPESIKDDLDRIRPGLSVVVRVKTGW